MRLLKLSPTATAARPCCWRYLIQPLQAAKKVLPSSNEKKSTIRVSSLTEIQTSSSALRTIHFLDIHAVNLTSRMGKRSSTSDTSSTDALDHTPRPPKMAKKNLFDEAESGSSSSSEEEVRDQEFKINEDYARRFEHNKKREERQRRRSLLDHHDCAKANEEQSRRNTRRKVPTTTKTTTTKTNHRMTRQRTKRAS